MAGLDPVLVKRAQILAYQANEYDERTWELLDTAAAPADAIADLANRTIAAFEDILNYIDARGEYLDVQTNEVNPTDQVDQTKIADVAFMARWDLQQRLRELEHAVEQRESGDRWVLLARCSSLRRRVLASVCEFERARCASVNAPFTLTEICRSRRELAVATRRAYRKFTKHIRTIAAGLDAGLLELGGALRLAAAAIAALIGEDVYVELRIEDRQELRRLQARLFTAVRDGDEFFQRRVWADLAGFGELLMLVNRRVELVIHDYELVCEVLARLATLGPGEELEQGWSARLSALAGRDAKLDALLTEAEGPALGVRLPGVLLELADELGRTLGRDAHAAQRGAFDPGLTLVHGSRNPVARRN